MIAIAIAAALAAATPTTEGDLGCAAAAWQFMTRRPQDTQQVAAAQKSYMFFLGRLTVEAPGQDWVSLITAKSQTFLAVPPVGMKPTDLVCGAVIKRIVPLPQEITQ